MEEQDALLAIQLVQFAYFKKVLEKDGKRKHRWVLLLVESLAVALFKERVLGIRSLKSSFFSTNLFKD